MKRAVHPHPNFSGLHPGCVVSTGADISDDVVIEHV